MDNLDRLDIASFMKLEDTINQLELRKEQFRQEQYQSNFCSHPVYDGFEIKTTSIRPDKFVEALDRFNRIVDKRIEVATMKHDYWKQFYNELSEMDQQYLFDRYVRNYAIYNPKLDDKCVSEIEEILTAINYRLWKVDSKPLDVVVDGDCLGNIEAILDAMGGL